MPPPVAIPSEAIAQIIRNGDSWSAVQGAPVTVTYAFRSTAPAGAPIGTFSQFTASQIAAAELALQAWADVANITFVRVGSGTFGNAAYSNSATILFGNYTGGANSASAAFAYSPDPAKTAAGELAGDVFVNTAVSSNTTNLSPGSFGFVTLLHEIGHAIGLEHPGNYNGSGATYDFDAAYAQDNTLYTIMSYFDGFSNIDRSRRGRAADGCFARKQLAISSSSERDSDQTLQSFGVAALRHCGRAVALRREDDDALGKYDLPFRIDYHCESAGGNRQRSDSLHDLGRRRRRHPQDHRYGGTLRRQFCRSTSWPLFRRRDHYRRADQVIPLIGNIAIGYGVTIENFEGTTQHFFGNEANNVYFEPVWPGLFNFPRSISTFGGDDTIFAHMTASLTSLPDATYDTFKIDGGTGFDVLVLGWISSDDQFAYKATLDLTKLTQIVNVEIWEIHARFQFPVVPVLGRPSSGSVLGRPVADVIIIDYSVPTFSIDPNTGGLLYGLGGNDTLVGGAFSDTLAAATATTG